MSERHNVHGPEHAPHHEQHEVQPQPAAEKIDHAAHRRHQAEQVGEIQKQIEDLAVSGKELSPGDAEHTHSHRPLSVNRELKAMALERTLQRARRRLSGPDKALSKVIHQPAVERLSDAGSRTVARPSGILGGGIVAFGGSLIAYLASRYYGYEYNFSVLIFLFIGGFFLGMIAEIAWHLRRRR